MTSLVQARQQRTRRLPRINRQSNDHFQFDGGLNLLDSPLSVQPGELASTLNYEVDIQGGYRRIAGYEAFDGSTSPSEASYWKMIHGKDGSDGRAIDRAVGNVIDGQASGASGSWLTATEEGGFGQNACINNEEFDNADWDIRQTGAPAASLTITDGAIAATTDHPKLSLLTDSVDSGDEHHWFETATANHFTVNEGEIVYVSCYAKAASDGHSIRVQIESAKFGTGNQDPAVDFDIQLGSVSATRNGINESGVDIVGGGVFRLWFSTYQAVEDQTDVEFRIYTYPLDSTVTPYTGTGTAKANVGGLQAVVLARETPHHLFEGRIFAGNTHWDSTATTLTPTDGDATAVASPFFKDMTKLVDAGSGDKTHFIRTTKSGNLTPLKVKAGDRLYIEWFGMYTAGQIEFVRMAPDVSYSSTIFGGDLLTCEFKIIAGSMAVESTEAGIDSASIQDGLGSNTDHYHIRILTNVAVADGDFGINFSHGIDDGFGDPDFFYTSTGLFSHISMFRAVALPDADGRIALATSDTTRHGYVKITTVAKNVATGSIILGGVTGTFQADEDLQFLSADWAQARTVATENGEADTGRDADYTALAVANASAAAAPTGSGPIRGVWEYNGVAYCFRNNTGGTEGQMFKETGAGWVLEVLNERLSFDNGDDPATPVIGDTLTGAGGASAPIRRIVITSGTFGVDAAGYFILGTVASGPFINDEQLQVSAADVALADGANAVQTLPAGGRYEFRNENFYGASDFFRMYGVNGVGLGFEFDDDITTGFFCEIETGTPTDTPTHLATHNFHLFYSFPGGSVQLSADGDPVSWTPIFGASEIAVGTDITGFNEEVGNSLFIFGRNRTWILQGNNRANFDLDDFNINAGAHEWSLERIGLGCYLDDRGFTTVLQTQRSGSVNFEENAISTLIQPLILDLISNTSPRASHLIKNRNIYRCYFADGRVVSIGFRQHEVAGHMTLSYPFTANCAVSGEDTNGAEIVFVGADDGFVYQIEKGTSFNGDPLRAFFRTVLYHSGSPGSFKKYAYARVDAQLFGQFSVKGRIEYDFDNDELNLGDELDFTTDEAGGYWDDFGWDNFTWDKSTSGIPQQKLEGEGVNAAVYLHSETTSDPVHVIRGMTLQWLPRRDDRRV